MAACWTACGGNQRTGPWPIISPGAAVLGLLAERALAVGTEMFLAEKTVKNYVSSLLQKMGFSCRTEAAVYATRSKGGQRPEG